MNAIYGDNLDNLLLGTVDIDWIFGYDGDDTVAGWLGADVMSGGAGTDTLLYSASGAGVLVNLTTGTGAFGDAEGDTFTGFEDITGSFFNDFLIGDSNQNTLSGSDGDDILSGMGGVDLLWGGEGIDFLYGGSSGDLLDGGEGSDSIAGEDGADTIWGGEGADTIIGGASGDSLFGGLGSDTLSYAGSTSGVTVDLTSGVGIGGHANLDTFSEFENITGSSHSDALLGDNGSNVLNGAGGNDQMTGRIGNDTYYVDSNFDATIELAGQGTDTVWSTITHTLQANVEHLYLQGTGNINGSGNELANSLIGNSGNNILNGQEGVDFMAGGLGNDTYYVDHHDDVTIEGANAGMDIVHAYDNYTLGFDIERLYLHGDAEEGTGNALSNRIYGNDNDNVLDGLSGADRAWGYEGDDIYIKDSAGDLFYETIAGAAGGVDSVVSYMSHTLGTNFENLYLTGAGNFNATGNTVNNVVGGNAGNNFIDGRQGADYLFGSNGLDNFLFTTALGAGNIDTIEDFTVVDDTIRLDDAIFTALSGGYLTVAEFHIGASAADASDRIVYNSATGALLYDSDGTGGAAAIQFAILDTGLAMTNGDVYVF
jgi:Ca2+-binding RTX toxin-like protein